MTFEQSIEKPRHRASVQSGKSPLIVRDCAVSFIVACRFGLDGSGHGGSPLLDWGTETMKRMKAYVVTLFVKLFAYCNEFAFSVGEEVSDARALDSSD